VHFAPPRHWLTGLWMVQNAPHDLTPLQGL
jgi:hypothetical protein